MDMSGAGRFVWRDLMTTDAGRAEEFYGALFGWKFVGQETGDCGPYRQIHLGERGIGGMMELDPALGVPPHWFAYATVPDVDAACERAIALGGQVKIPGTDIPNTGRFAVILGPEGAPIAPFSFAFEAPPETDGPPVPGSFCWPELLTDDPEAARRFYGEIFGWGFGEMDMGEMGTYWVLKRGEEGLGGLMKLPSDAPHPPHWIQYIAVEDVDASAAKAENLGGQVFVPPGDIPGVGRFSVLADPMGALFALFRHGEG
jgi:uncharacterized protein